MVHLEVSSQCGDSCAKKWSNSQIAEGKGRGSWNVYDLSCVSTQTVCEWKYMAISMSSWIYVI